MASTHSTQIELNNYSQQPSTTALTDLELLPEDATARSATNEGFSLPPTDGGKDAWLCLLSCFMLEAMIWGMSHDPSCTPLI